MTRPNKDKFRVDTRKGDPAVVDALYKPHTRWPKLADNFIRLPRWYSFDVKAAIAEMEGLRTRFPFEQVKIEKDKKKFTYRGLGLTTRKGSDNPLYDSLNVYSDNETQLEINTVIHSTSDRNDNPSLYPIRERIFSQKTEACTPFFDKILSKFRSTYLKVRLLELRPGGILTSHIDFPYYEGVRLHAVLTTNDDCWWEVNGQQKQLPADGHFWLMDVGKYHSVWNSGTTSRIVLSVNLSPYKDRDGHDRYCPGFEPTLATLIATLRL